jgi:predicted transcriptional regulator
MYDSLSRGVFTRAQPLLPAIGVVRAAPGIDPARRVAAVFGQWPNGINLFRIRSCPSTYRYLIADVVLPSQASALPLRLTLKLRNRKDVAEGFRTAGSMLGPLETRLLELLWSQRGPATVRHIRRALPELAYTTIMTTLDRLYRKGLLLRDRDGRAFTYAPRYTRAELLTEVISGHVADLLGAAEEGTVLLSTLVRAVGRMDAALLDELDALVQAERLRHRREAK